MERKHIWYGLICGGMSTIFMNLSFILFIYSEAYVSFLPAVLICFLCVFLLRFDKMGSFFYSIFFAAISFISTNFLITFSGISLYVYRILFGFSEFSLGDGILMVMCFLVYSKALIIGIIIACVLTVLKTRKVNHQNNH